MDRVIWLPGWEMQCCGKPFSVGSTVTWSVGPGYADWLEANVLGSEARRLTDFYDAHPSDPSTVHDVAGTVARIDAVMCRYAASPGADPRHLAPVLGSATIESRSEADGRQPEDHDVRVFFAGYVVTVVEP